MDRKSVASGVLAAGKAVGIAAVFFWLTEAGTASEIPNPRILLGAIQQLEVPASSTVTNASGSKTEVSIVVEDGYRIIHANGLPDHKTGQFPNRGNPNHIQAQHYVFRVPASPMIADKPTPLGMNPFGIAVNGVVFDPGAAEWWNHDPRSGWRYEPMSGAINLGVDQSNAHVQPSGAYHYHAIPMALLYQLTGGQPRMILLGWAADGFPIFGPWCPAIPNTPNSSLKKMKSSYRLKSGKRPSGPGGTYDGSFVEDYEYVKGTGDLDECNGRYGIAPEFPSGTYYYVLTEDFPFIPRLLKGTPDPSFRRHAPLAGLRRPPHTEAERLLPSPDR